MISHEVHLSGPVYLEVLFTMYSKILLICLLWYQRGAGLLDIPDFQAVSVLTKVLGGNFLLLLLYLGYTTARGIFHLDSSFIYWFRVIRSSSVFSGVFLGELDSGV
jgi:hypothetical protein